MGSRYRHLCPYGSPAYLHSSFRRGAGLVSPATTSADSATLARVDEFLMNSRRNFGELRYGEVRRILLPRTQVNKGKKKRRKDRGCSRPDPLLYSVDRLEP